MTEQQEHLIKAIEGAIIGIAATSEHQEITPTNTCTTIKPIHPTKNHPYLTITPTTNKKTGNSRFFYAKNKQTIKAPKSHQISKNSRLTKSAVNPQITHPLLRGFWNFFLN